MSRLFMPALMAGALALLLHVLEADAQGQRQPTREEMSQIETALKGENFIRWDDIERNEDGTWEVEEAVAPDGRSYDLKLDQSFRIISRDLN